MCWDVRVALEPVFSVGVCLGGVKRLGAIERIPKGAISGPFAGLMQLQN